MELFWGIYAMVFRLSITCIAAHRGDTAAQGHHTVAFTFVSLHRAPPGGYMYSNRGCTVLSADECEAPVIHQSAAACSLLQIFDQTVEFAASAPLFLAAHGGDSASQVSGSSLPLSTTIASLRMCSSSADPGPLAAVTSECVRSSRLQLGPAPERQKRRTGLEFGAAVELRFVHDPTCRTSEPLEPVVVSDTQEEAEACQVGVAYSPILD